MNHPPDRGGLHRQALGWHRSLCEENRDIDWELAETVGRQIDAIADELEFDEDYRLGCRKHRFRIAVSIAELRKTLRPGARALELGGTTFVTHLLLAHLPEVDWRTSRWDLRKPWPTESGSFDAVVAMEVLEHLSDPEERRNEQLEMRGLRTCLAESCRTLRPEGVLFATTPNSASVLCLLKILGGATAVNYSPHIREYCREEIQRELHEAGYVVDSLRAVHCMALDEPVNYTPAFRLLLELGYPTEDRGDDWFLRAHRPGPAASGLEAP